MFSLVIPFTKSHPRMQLEFGPVAPELPGTQTLIGTAVNDTMIGPMDT